MEHLIVQLSYEARIGGLVEYKWMYPSKRFLHDLKKKVKNKDTLRRPLSRHTLSKRSGYSLPTTLSVHSLQMKQAR
ncbi:UNVERIFIED_CONTAM: hypothetical protein Slati_3755300 [Sesamum latifolium]|uniref:DUF4218 domain-containing protein n=1 Tax=Sesamum latifolium TaxID=2727402 RepID=A0AAW2U7M6_9LAMI